MFECQDYFCSERFEDPSEFIAHMKLRHNLREFKCILCNSAFSSAAYYKRHLIKEINKYRLEETCELMEVLPFHDELNSTDCSLEFLIIPKNFEEEHALEQFPVRIFEMLLDLYGDMRVTKKLAGDIAKQIQNDLCMPLLKNLQSKMKCAEDRMCLEECLKGVDDLFNKVNTEHKFKKLLQKSNLYFEPREFEIAGQRKNSKGCVFSLRSNISTLFHTKPDLLLDMLIKYEATVADEDSAYITSLVDGEIWKEKIRKFAGKKVLPILLYQDDIEINNPLGSKSGKQKMSTVYISFPLLDDLCVSKLSYHFPANLTFSSDFSKGLFPNYYEISIVLKDIEENGVQFTMWGQTVTVHFIVATSVGDNLGQNMILGYTMSFNHDFFCRFCITTKIASEIEVTENSDILRCDLDNVQSRLGIKRDTPFETEIETFKVKDCISVDVVHDFLEGFGKIEISGILKHFIKMDYISLDFLNNSIQNFSQYSRLQKKNKCSKIKKEHLDSNTLKMSASEMCLFINYFTIFVAEHVPPKDEYWIFFKLFYKLLNKVMQFKFNENDLTELKQLIRDHNEKCIRLKLCGNPHPDRLIPKHHILTHYVTCIRKLGPPKFLWVMRMEAFHKCLKHYCNSTSSRKNIIKSTAVKLQYHNSNIFYKNLTEVKIKKSKIYQQVILQNYELEESTVNISLTDPLSTYFYITIENIRFEINDIVFSQNNESESFCLYNIHKIKHIFFENNRIAFLLLNLEKKCYNEDIQMLEIVYPETPSYCLLNVDDIVRPPTNIKKYKKKLVINISNF